jgi:AcrR family transcriptional regulator
MGAVQRREREKAEFREDVLQAARKIVLAEGYGALTMRKIAEAIEYAPGTIYLYFESRDAIASELCQRGFEELMQFLAPAAAVADPRDRILKIGELYCLFGLTHSETYRLIFMEDPKFSSAIFEEIEQDENAPGHRAFDFLTHAFDELRAEGRIKVDATSELLAEIAWASVHGIVSLKLTCPTMPRSPAEELSRVMTHAVLDGLLK